MLTSWKESYDQPRQHIKKQRHHFVNKGPSSQGYGFSNGHVWMWQLDCEESWVPKNWCFWTVVLEKTIESPWTARRFNQSILKEISPGGSLEGLMLKLKLQYFGPQCEELTHMKRPWCWERLRAGGEGVDRGWDGWMASRTQWTWVWVDSGSWWCYSTISSSVVPFSSCLQSFLRVFSNTTVQKHHFFCAQLSL